MLAAAFDSTKPMLEEKEKSIIKYQKEVKKNRTQIGNFEKIIYGSTLSNRSGLKARLNKQRTLGTSKRKQSATTPTTLRRTWSLKQPSDDLGI